MEHVVFFPAQDGSPAFRRVSNLEDAVRLVEHLRNVELVNEVSCHALTQVPLAFRAYYRVEVSGADDAGVEAAVMAHSVSEPAHSMREAGEPTESMSEPAELEVASLADAVAAPQVEVDQASAEPVMATVNGRSADGAKSLGFFA